MEKEMYAKKMALEAKKNAYKLSHAIDKAVEAVVSPFKRGWKIAVISSVGLFANASYANAQGYHYERQTVAAAQAQAAGANAIYDVYNIIQYKGSYYMYSDYFSQGLNTIGRMDNNGNISHCGYHHARIQCTRDGYPVENANVLLVPKNLEVNDMEVWQKNVLLGQKKDRIGPYRHSNIRGGYRVAPGRVGRPSKIDRVAHDVHQGARIARDVMFIGGVIRAITK